MRTNQFYFHVVFAALLALISPITARAQLVADSATKTINGTSTNIIGDLTIGTNGPFTTLIITNTGTVTNSGDGRIGFQNTSKTNQVIVTGTNSVWSIGLILDLGVLGDFNRLVVTNGGRLNSSGGKIGDAITSFGNVAVVTGGGSLWSTTSSTLTIGEDGSTNGLVISNGGKVASFGGEIGDTGPAHDNYVIITGAGSLWANDFALDIGSSGSSNILTITNGGVVANSAGRIGNLANSGNNRVLVTGANSTWTNRTDLFVGELGSLNQLTVTNAGTVMAGNLYVGFNPASSNNTVTLVGGNIIVTNAAGTSVTDVRRGTLTLNSGFLITGRLLLTNGAQSVLDFNGGSLQTRNTTNDNGTVFIVGDGASTATFELLGSGTHRFFNGLRIANNAMLKGNGTIIGNVTNTSGGTLSPGASIGKLTITSNLVLATGSTNVFEIDKSSATNDNIVGLTGVSYGGTLIVTNLSGTLTSGDNFKLFTASSYAGAFSTLALPPLDPGLVWTNKLLVDGSIEVLFPPPTDRFWTNKLGGNYNVTANWLAGAVPFPQDNANFTNNASYQVNWTADALAANAFFNANSGTVTQAIGSANWTLTNSYIVGRDAGATANVAQVSGTLNVTNAAGNAVIETRRGTLRLDAGTINADQFIATNSAGQFTFNGGTLITRGGAISNGLAFAVGASNTPAILDVRSGQALVAYGGDFILGLNAPNCRLLVTNGGTFRTLWTSYVGYNRSSSNNAVTVSGAGSLWTNSGDLYLGYSGSFNQLVVTNEAVVAAHTIYVGAGGSNNLGIVTGMNSTWYANSVLVGDSGASGAFNSLLVTNGGTVQCENGILGSPSTTSSNSIVVTGTNSLWRGKELTVGFSSVNCTLTVSDSATVAVESLIVSVLPNPSLGNNIIVNGGTIIVTNATGTGTIDVRRDRIILNSGLVVTDQLLVTNVQHVDRFDLHGGTLRAGSSAYNDVPFTVGDGTSSAAFELLGNGTHRYNYYGLQIANNALLKGNGTIIGDVTNTSGGTLSPGSSIGKLTINGNLTLAAGSINIFELEKSSITNDNIIVLTNVAYGGALIITNLSGTLASGDNFKLFTASSYSGAFSTLALPPLDLGLGWTNKLLVDGSIEVISNPPGDRYWTNALGGNYDVAGNWLDNLVPTVLDNANFTNSATYQVNWTANAVAANAFFNAAGGTVSDNLGSFTWTITNSYIVGRDAGSAPTNAHLSGTLNVTNVAGDAVLESRRGALQLLGGKINTDRLIATNLSGQISISGGTLIARGGMVSNSLSVDGVLDVRAGTSLVISDGVLLGPNTANSRLWITNGGTLETRGPSGSILGFNSGGSDALVIVGRAGSLWTNDANLVVGRAAGLNGMSIFGGGTVIDDSATIGNMATSDNNAVTVTGAGSLWVNRTTLTIGSSGSFNFLTLTNGGALTANALFVGAESGSSDNWLILGGGNVTNSSRTDIRRGTLRLISGTLNTDRLWLTNGVNSLLVFSGGTLQTGNTICSNNAAFVIGNGSSAATLELLGNGTHIFDKGLQISTNALLKGNGTIIGNITNKPGGTLSPGASIGKLVVNGNLLLTTGSTNVFELDKAAGTNDSIVGLTSIALRGTLIVTNLGGTLTNGDSFKLFSATNYNGAFNQIVPSTPGAGLKWNTNGLVIDGTLRVVSDPSPPPVIGSVTLLSGTNLVLSASGGVSYDPVYLLTATNIALPTTNWVSLLTNHFDSVGNLSVTNVITPGEPARYFHLQVE